LIAALCDEVGLADIVNSVVRWDERQWKLSPGVLCKALVVNVLAGRKPLYKVEEFYAEQDVEKVLGEGVRAEDINDDALGRTLDRMAQVDLKALFSSVSLSCVLKDNIEVKSVHADTTSISVYGEYEDDSAIIEINHGHSKDKRPDLQQFVYGLLVNTEGIPLAGDVLSGNTSDRTWNGKVIKELEALWNAARTLCTLPTQRW